MNLLESSILGTVQGLTEWLPVSSSGHLVLVQELMKINVSIAFDIWLHLATLLVLPIYFRRDIINMAKALLSFDKGSKDFKLALKIIIATAVTSLIVLSFKEAFERAFSSMLVLGAGFLITGVILLISRGGSSDKEVSYKHAILIGIIQAIAFIPGISRSGSTIAFALILGIKRLEAFRFSFLIAIPAILGAGILKTPELFLSQSIPLSYLLAGFITSFLFGFLTLILLKRIVRNKKLHYFACYCIAIGIITLIIYLK